MRQSNIYKAFISSEERMLNVFWEINFDFSSCMYECNVHPVAWSNP